MGFTLIELLVVVAIAVFVAVLVVSNISGLRRSAALGQAVDETLGLLREARSKTLSSEGASGYGVRFEADRVILFRGGAYVAGHPDNITLTLPAGVAISAVNLTTTTASVAFERLTGASAATGTVTFLGAGNVEKRIEILASGLFIKQ